ncbi:NADase-type glycan-binding domain-containing protein [Streptomyces globosus]|uniref:NADase-type glycan-binding domain-containing protein n=1 Tax=Streptomyces globosus TaxID=68209 RepID=UPI0037F32A44
MPETGTSPCPECAAPTRTSGQSFCDSCGAFLRWDAAGTPRGGRAPEPAPRGGAADPAEAETLPLPSVPPAAGGTARQEAADPAADREPDAAAASGPGGGAPGRAGRPAPERVPDAAGGSGPAGGGAPARAAGPAAGGRPTPRPDTDGGPEGGREGGGAPAGDARGPSDRAPEPDRAPDPGTRGGRDPEPGADGGGADPVGDGASRRKADPEPSPAPPAAATTAPLRPGARSDPEAAASAAAARALLVPVPAAEAAPDPGDAPGTVLPGVPEAARPRVRAPQPADPAPQGPPCPACGAPNPPRRTFCRSCASRLEDARPESAEGPFAGQRPRLDRGRRRWIVRALVVTGLALLLVGGVIGGPPAVRAVQDHFAKRVAVRPTGWSASHSGAGHGPELVFDSYSNTWWGTGYAGDSNGQHLQADFAQPVDLLAVLVTPGTSKRPGQAADQARPQEIDLVVTDSAGRTKTVHKTLDDGGVQRVEVRRRDAVSVRIVLRSAYGAGADRQVAVAEVEFFGRSRT